MKITTFNTDLTNAILKSLKDEKNKRYIEQKRNLSHFILDIPFWGFAEVKINKESILVMLNRTLVKSLGFPTMTAFLHSLLGEKYSSKKRPPKNLEIIGNGKHSYITLKTNNYESI